MKDLLQVISILIGMALGALLGIGIPILLAISYLKTGGDETAAGAFSFFPMITLPFGAIAGGILGGLYPLGRKRFATFSAEQLLPEIKYKVIKSFTDYDGVLHERNEEWKFIRKEYLPHDDGLSLFVKYEEKEMQIRLQSRKEAQLDIIDAFHKYVKKINANKAMERNFE